MLSIDSYNKKTPSIKKSIEDKLVIGGLVEGIYYKIEEINNAEFLTGNEPPKIGEQISIQYDFCKEFQGYSGWETICLFIGRFEKTVGTINNYVRYFKNAGELESVIANVKFSKDIDYAKSCIKSHKEYIEQLEKNYELK